LLNASQLLQTQNQVPQTVSEISSQLQGAARQQVQSVQGNALTNLANQFQNVANTGELPRPQFKYPKYSGGATYSSAGQPIEPSGGRSSDLQQLLANIASEVSAALGN
jgi:hypothetical protein